MIQEKNQVSGVRKGKGGEVQEGNDESHSTLQ